MLSEMTDEQNHTGKHRSFIMHSPTTFRPLTDDDVLKYCPKPRLCRCFVMRHCSGTVCGETGSR